jgi:hypothetical protein
MKRQATGNPQPQHFCVCDIFPGTIPRRIFFNGIDHFNFKVECGFNWFNTRSAHTPLAVSDFPADGSLWTSTLNSGTSGLFTVFFFFFEL